VNIEGAFHYAAKMAAEKLRAERAAARKRKKAAPA
jgi:hypothetical protein